MNRMFKYALLGLLTILPAKSFASDVYLLLGIEDSRKTHIHQNIVTKTGLHKSNPDNYHVTLACVEKVDPKDQSALKEYLKTQLKAKYPNFVFDQGKKKGQFAMSVGLKKAERYLVGGRKHDHCPLVFYFLPRHHDLLKEMNTFLALCLPGFKSPSGKKYSEFAHDQQPHNYIPHMTIANGKYIDGQKADRDEVIGKLNHNLGQAAKGLPDGEYRFKLRI